MGFGVAKPYSEGERFDFILISRGWPEGDKLWRVQVKSTTSKMGKLYRAMAQRRSRGRWVPYSPLEVDFIVVHVVPEDSWFVVPIQAVPGRMNLLFSPKEGPQNGKLDGYREDWDLARPPKSGRRGVTSDVTDHSYISCPVIASHPGEYLSRELKALEMSAAELARKIGVPRNRVTQILNGTRVITGDTALRLAHFFGNSSQFWMNLQGLYELRRAQKKSGKVIKALPTMKR